MNEVFVNKVDAYQCRHLIILWLISHIVSKASYAGCIYLPCTISSEIYKKYLRTIPKQLFKNFTSNFSNEKTKKIIKKLKEGLNLLDKLCYWYFFYRVENELFPSIKAHLKELKKPFLEQSKQISLITLNGSISIPLAFIARILNAKSYKYGKKLIQKNAAINILKQFLEEWQNNKSFTPLMLHEDFEELLNIDEQELKKRAYGKVKKIRKLVRISCLND